MRIGDVTMTAEESNSWKPEIHGWSTDILQVFNELAKVFPDGGSYLEIGVHHGRSLIFLAEQVYARGKGGVFWGVDPFEEDPADYRIAMTHVSKSRASRSIHLLRATSAEARSTAPRAMVSFDVVFFDGDHTHSGVGLDHDLWASSVKPGGLLMGHDYSKPGVQAYLKEYGLLEKVERFADVWWVANDSGRTRFACRVHGFQDERLCRECRER